jgi:hypothetical protein
MLLMRDCRDDCGFATAIRPLAYLRGYELLKGGWQFYGIGRHSGASIRDRRTSSNQKFGNVAKTERLMPFHALRCLCRVRAGLLGPLDIEPWEMALARSY